MKTTKTLIAVIFMICTLSAKGQPTTDEGMVIVFGNKMIENLSGSYVIGKPFRDDEFYMMKISCPERTDFEDVSFAWTVGIANGFSDIVVFRQWSFSDNAYNLWFEVEGMEKSFFTILYYSVKQIIFVGHYYKTTT